MMRGLTMIGMTIGLQLACNTAARIPAPSAAPAQGVKRVLLISVDGLHSLDLVKWVKKRPDGALSQASRRRVLFLLGPSVTGLDDIYAPDGHAPGVKQNVEKSEAFDELGVTATLNQINGKDHTGQRTVGTPMIFGMTFVSVSVAQKLKGNGYVTDGTPSSGVENALRYVNTSIGRMVQALKAANLVEGPGKDSRRLSPGSEPMRGQPWR